MSHPFQRSSGEAGASGVYADTNIPEGKTINMNNITSFYGSSCANNGNDALNTPKLTPQAGG
eukprot:4612705-Pyramimonas_sp.AAC.3